MKLDEKFGHLVAEIRSAKGLSRSEVAVAVGVTEGMYYKLEKAQRKWTLEYLEATARALDARPWELIAALFDEEPEIGVPVESRLSPEVQTLVDTYKLLGPKAVILLMLDRLEKQ